MDFNLGNIIKGIAPMLATALGGPLAGLAVKVIAGAVLPDDQIQVAAGTGNPIDALQTSISTAIQNGVADMSKLKQAEQDFKLRMAELGYKQVADLERIAADDRSSARTMQIQVKSIIPPLLAIGITVGFFCILGGMLVGDFQTAENSAFNIMLGALGTAWASVVAYYFGSSAGSAAKNDMLAQTISK